VKRKLSNQELRTRKDLLQAASRLLKKGRKPTMDAVAVEALVSRPTAYRYFRSLDELLLEASVDIFMADPGELFPESATDDPEARIDIAEESVHRVMYAHEAQMRILLSSSVERSLDKNSPPNRQNRREPLIEAALAPIRKQLTKQEFIRLRRALSFFLGPEGLIVAQDVLRIDEPTARKVKSWSVRTLVHGALAAKKSVPKNKPSENDELLMIPRQVNRHLLVFPHLEDFEHLAGIENTPWI
jgi:AcrR family transcriptional regulator